MPHQFSVNFSDPRSDGIKACDWRWPENKPVWSMSSRGETETRWYVDGPLTEEGRKELLKRFGLESVADQLPLETIATMSPARLTFIGEALEGFMERKPVYSHSAIEQERVGEHAPFSDQIGDHCSAELVAA